MDLGVAGSIPVAHPFYFVLSIGLNHPPHLFKNGLVSTGLEKGGKKFECGDKKDASEYALEPYSRKMIGAQPGSKNSSEKCHQDHPGQKGRQRETVPCEAAQ